MRIPQLLAERMPSRLREFPAEAKWAFGSASYPKETKPPEWLRKVIRCFYGLPPVQPKDAPKITEKQLVEFIGATKGISDAGRVWAQQPVDPAEFRPEFLAVAIELKQKLSDVFQPHIQDIEKAHAALPQKIYEKDVETFAAYTKAKSDGVASIFQDDDQGTITEELLWFFWMMWPELEAKKSVTELYAWIQHLGFTHCSQKLLEKICAKVGYRRAPRGRPKKN